MIWIRNSNVPNDEGELTCLLYCMNEIAENKLMKWYLENEREIMLVIYFPGKKRTK